VGLIYYQYHINMELKWLEDFCALADTGSFSRAAQARHVSQPAFSRRIQSLEAWVGAALIDRTTFPTRLTPAGEVFIEHAQTLIESAAHSRAFARGKPMSARDTLSFAVPHAVSFGFFPRWFVALEARLGTIPARLAALNVHDAVLQLVERSCDLLICYHHASQPIELDEARYEMLVLSREQLRPVTAAKNGRAQFKLPGTAQRAIPYLAYAPNAYLSRITEQLVANAGPALYLERCYETDMAEGLKMLALQGKGVAFVPDGSVQGEIANGSLKFADNKLAAPLEVRLYRERPSRERPSPKRCDEVWQFLAGLPEAQRSLH
jgi:LysR family transcriptional regulator, hypochlorite-specific transcription factor HypT